MKFTVNLYWSYISLIILAFSNWTCERNITVPMMFAEFVDRPHRQYFPNDLLVPYDTSGHIQGIQYFWDEENRGYYFLTGSSDDVSYYLIADETQQKVIQVDTFFSGALRHAGGFQIVDRYLAVGLEDNVKKDRSKVCWYEIEGSANKKLKLLKTIDRQGPEKRFTAGCVAAIEWRNYWLVAVGNWDTRQIDIYRLERAELDNPASTFDLASTFDIQTADRSNWSDTTWHAYQNISFLKDRDQLYLAGTAKVDSSNLEVIDLFTVHPKAGNVTSLQKIQQQIFENPDTLTTFKWGGGIRRNGHDELEIYATQRNAGDSLCFDVYFTARFPYN